MGHIWSSHLGKKGSLPALRMVTLTPTFLVCIPDSLFEMGFEVQLHEILHRLQPNRQTLLFSATLPKLLVDFAKAGLQEPTLVRLDVDTKISKDLEVNLRSTLSLPFLIHIKQLRYIQARVYIFNAVLPMTVDGILQYQAAGQGGGTVDSSS
jgi:hypothetical protein